MPIESTPKFGVSGQQKYGPEGTDFVTRTARLYPMRIFPGQPRWPATGWIIVDLVAFPASSPDCPVIRTFQARDLINDNVSVNLPALRANSFFTEVRKLLVFCGRIDGSNLSVWDDQVLNQRGLEVQNAKIVALTDDTSLWDGTQMLEDGNVVKVFERATDRGLEKLTIYVAWYDSSLSQEVSLVRQQIRQRIHSTGARKRLLCKTDVID